jgi:hypothetical protein
MAFSYSVLQHFPKGEARRSIGEIGRILRIGGEALVQMPNKLGIVCLLHQLRRGFRPARDFEVRYWGPNELCSTFRELVGVTSIKAEGFLGLGVGPIDPTQVKPLLRPIVWTSKTLTRFSQIVPPFAKMADSLYVSARKEPMQRS